MLEKLITLQYLYELPNNTGQIDQLVIDTITIIPGFLEMLLFFVWGIIFFGGIVRQNLKTGTADYPMWSVIASLSIMILSLILTIQSGFIDIVSLVIIITITIFSGVWLFLDRRSSEL